ncbi:MAG: porin family protein [Candidatus Tectomicrobia bacterium]|uniref:Porin family protein n=1 Tax=Tectimicrobiota bacterium TaxID=2528274 RepID=A0A938B4F7_UNCTE|nr:porin family protein [Candidatus Tectomicrobia bacterium]
MQGRIRWWCAVALFGWLFYGLALHAVAGTIGYPVPRLKPLHARVELVGDSFQENLQGLNDPRATTGRGLLTAAFAPTDWSEIYGRFGMGEFNVRRAGFNGDFGFAYGGGARLRLFQLSWGSGGITGQYLRFQSDDNNNPNREGTWEEVDIALGVGSRRFGAFQFYGGGAYHYTDVTLKDTRARTRTRLESKIPGRLFVGVHIYPLVDFPGGEFVVNVEARFLGETPQVTLGLQYSF